MRNKGNRDNALVRDGICELQRRLPSGWVVRDAELSSEGEGIDASVEIRSPDRRVGRLVIEAKHNLEPRAVAPAIAAARRTGRVGALVVLSRYLSERTRTLLRELDVSYLDLTGNVRIAVSKPGLFIETQGASEAPDRQDRPARTLKGAKAGRIVRALVDRKQPPGVRELAALAQVDAGYVSRVLALLDHEALVTRIDRGRVKHVDWPALLRRWGHDAPIAARGQPYSCLDPRGPAALFARLAKSNERYAITGSFAAAAFAPLAPARLATIWIDDAAEAAVRLGVRPSEAGANVLLVEPLDENVFEGAGQRDSLWYAAPSQIAADLLTSPGQGPAEGDELIAWMRANEDVWRR